VATLRHYPQFWNIETDRSGNPVSADVRVAAHQVWPVVLREVHWRCGDESEAAEIIEQAMLQTSRYLNRPGSAGPVQSMPGLVLTISRRLLRRRSRNWPRFQCLNWGNQRALSVADWEDQANRAILVRELTSRLSHESARILTLRMGEYGWEEIALILNTTVSAAKNRFWRELGSLKAAASRPRTAFRKSA
jgi:DNA-directed RNA polymerase specialized sigma24 family protein